MAQESTALQPDYLTKRIDVTGDPFDGWHITVVHDHHKDIDLVYGPYQYVSDAITVGKRVRRALDEEATRDQPDRSNMVTTKIPVAPPPPARS